MKVLTAPTDEERRYHNLMQYPYKEWREHCVRGRGREDRHHQQVRGPEDTYVYPNGHRYHRARECTAVTSARSNPRHYTKCRICETTVRALYICDRVQPFLAVREHR
eukprot:2975698-Amphidinium_carterae.3